MLMKSGLLLLLVTVLQVSGRYKNGVEPDFIENVIKREYEALELSSPGSRIVSGWEALPGQHPHHAALRMVSPIGGVSACGGSIVSKEWVITAAHCTAGRVTVVVRGGVVSLTTPEYISETTEYYNHPLYNNNQPAVVQPHDISLVKVQHPFVYSRLLKSIRIHSRADAYRDYDNQVLYASGHGRTWTDGSVTEVLRWVYLRAISNLSCASTFVSGIIIDTSICARFYNVTSQSTCQGDSGGPLVYVGSDGVPTLVGVTSFVAGGQWGCHSGLPAGFVRPGPYLSWFEEVTGIDFENLQEDDDSEEESTLSPTSSSALPEPTTTSLPSTTTSLPSTTTSLPSTTTSLPSTTTSLPSTTTSLPSTTTSLPSTITSLPSTTTSLPSTITSPPSTILPTTEDSDDDDVTGSPESEESTEAPEGGDSSEDSDSSDSNDDELSQLLKRLEVKVKVKVSMNKYKVKNEVEKEKEIRKHHHN